MKGPNLRGLFARDQGVTETRHTIAKIWELDEERDKPEEAGQGTSKPAGAGGASVAAESRGQEPGDKEADVVVQLPCPPGYGNVSEPSASQVRVGGAEETARDTQASQTFAIAQSAQTQAELCVGRFDQRVRELKALLESAEVLGHIAAKDLEQLFEAKESHRALAQLSVGRFDQRIGQLAEALEPVEALCQSTAQELDRLRSLQGELAGLATTLSSMKASYEQLEPLAGRFESIKSLFQQMADMPSEFRADLTLLAKSLEPARAVQARVAELARTLEPLNEWTARFDELVAAFEARLEGETGFRGAERHDRMA